MAKNVLEMYFTKIYSMRISLRSPLLDVRELPKQSASRTFWRTQILFTLERKSCATVLGGALFT